MILVDTSIWVDHLGAAENPTLAGFLAARQVLLHPFVLGEIALGNLTRRSALLSRLSDLPRAQVAELGEVLTLVERHNLHGSGVGYVDAHLLATMLLTNEAMLWTRDKRLLAAALRMRLAVQAHLH